MILGVWNVRGLNSSIKQREVRLFIQSNALSLCVVLESHIGVSKLNDIATSVFGAWSWISNQAHSPNGVRVLLGWNPFNVDAMIIGMTDQVIHCKIVLKNSSKSFFYFLCLWQ